MLSRRNRRETEPEGGPGMERWLLTYSDMITLLMIFFIMMYVISNVNTEKFKALADNLSMVLRGAPPSGIMQDGSGSPVPAITGEAAQMAELEKELKEFISKEHLTGQISVQMEERGLVVSFQATVLFDRGSAELTPEAKRIIAVLSAKLKNMPNYLRVEGHTCNLPINTPLFPSNWELSTARATNVVEELIASSGIPANRLSATGYGEYRPLYPNDSESNRQMNRRIDILILKTKYAQVEPEQGSNTEMNKEDPGVTN